MKRNLILLVAAIGIVAISTGCSSQDTKVLEDKVSQLEQQLSSQSSQAADDSSASESMPANHANATVSSSLEPPAQNSSAAQQPNFDTTELTKKVDAVIQLADATQPKATYQENVTLYGQVKMQIKQVEFEVEQFEHQIEAASRTGAISYAQYQELDRVADQLDHRLDMAKDSLEFRLGVDD